MRQSCKQLVWREVQWARPVTQTDVLELLTHLASLSPRRQVVWEVRGHGEQVRYFIGTERRYFRHLKAAFTAHGDIRFSKTEADQRLAVTTAKQLKISKPILPLRTDNLPAVLKTALAALSAATGDETTVLQIVLGDSLPPAPAPEHLPDPHATFLDAMCGKAGGASKDSLAAIRTKTTQHGFCALIRFGARAGNPERTNDLLLGILSSFRQMESAGVRLQTVATDPSQLNAAKIPWYLPLRLSVAELAGFLLLPCTDMALSGTPALHPKLLRPPRWLKEPVKGTERSFGVSLDAGSPIKLHIAPKDALEHTVLLGPTGSGKSTAMLNLILADIRAGYGTLVVDPKADLVNDILARIPVEREADVVVLDPSDPSPVGLNPFCFSKKHAPSQISDTIIAVFREIFTDNWGIHTQDVLSGALLSLAHTENATLLMLPRLLTDDRFRRQITQSLTDTGLVDFWAGYEAMSKTQRAQVIAPVMNKLRQFSLRPALRNMLGQAHPKFSLSDLFSEQKIVLVPLNKGLVGAETARLLGSLTVGLVWTLALARAGEPVEKRHMVSVFIDELQDYLSLPTDFDDALAQARGLGVAFTVAHQYRAQLSPLTKAALDANARNKIVFGLNATDAREMAVGAPELTPIDFMTLPRYQVYTLFQVNGRRTGWLSGRTLPPPPTIRGAADLRAQSMARYGQTPNVINAADTAHEPAVALETIGRKRRT